MVSMKDISERCGVSIATVSKALNDHNDVGIKTKERIKKTAKEMGYFPNSAAKALKTNRTYNLGVLFADEAHNGLTQDYFAHVLDSFKKKAEEKGYDITFINTNKNSPNNMSYLEHCRSRGFDGVIIACIDFYSPDVMKLIESNIPIVTIDHLFDNRSAVVSNNVKGMEELVKYIYTQNHRKIAYIHGDNSAVTQNRLSSFYRTCELLGIHVPDEYVRAAYYRDTKHTYEETKKLLELEDPPTCIIYPDDFSCFGGINAIHEKGLSIPRDISIAGYDGLGIARHIEPQLTTVTQDTETIGRTAAEKLIELIENPKTTLKDHIVVRGKLYQGASVANIHSSVCT